MVISNPRNVSRYQRDTTHNTNDWAIVKSAKNGAKSGAPGGKAVTAALVSPVLLLI